MILNHEETDINIKIMIYHTSDYKPVEDKVFMIIDTKTRRNGHNHH